MDESSFRRFDLSASYSADCQVMDGLRAGEIYHVRRNSAGGATMTPIANYFCTRPEFIEGFHGHWRVDCYVREHDLSPSPMPLGKLLVAALMREQLCGEPLWLSVHRSKELEGEAFGEVFDYG